MIRYSSPFAGDYKLINKTNNFEYKMEKESVEVSLYGILGRTGNIKTDLRADLSTASIFRGRPNNRRDRRRLAFTLDTGTSQAPLGKYTTSETIPRSKNQGEEVDFPVISGGDSIVGGGGGGSGGKSTKRTTYRYYLNVVSGPCVSATPVPTTKGITITGTMKSNTPDHAVTIRSETIGGETYALLYPKGSGAPTTDSVPTDFTSVNDNGEYKFENQQPGEYDILSFELQISSVE
jgi:hypothetical protein